MGKKKSGKSRITSSLTRYHTYINLTLGYLTAAICSRLGIPTGTGSWLAQWTAFGTEDGLYYPNWSNKKIRTTDMTDHLKANIKACKAFNKSAKFLDFIAANPNAILMDFEVFNITHNSPAATGVATERTAVIDHTVVISVFYQGGGRIKFQCRPKGTSGKSHIPEGSDELEMRIKLRKTTDPVSTGPDDSTPAWNQKSSKAIVTVDFTPANIHMAIDVYARFIDSKHLSRAGAYTPVMTLGVV
ncbi:MAG TPA: hypothetical protein VF411_10540 [Bacteroidia bacterium]